MSRITLILITVIMLAGCGKTIEKFQRQQQAERIVERTITKPVTSTITIEKYVNLPPELLGKCGITYRKNNKVAEYVRVADTNTAYLEDCAAQVEAIRNLQPLPVK